MRLGDIVDIQIGKTPSRSNPSYWGNGYTWISISDLSRELKEDKYIGGSSEQITEEAVQETGIRLIPENTILYSFKLSIGKVAITSKPVFTNEAIAALHIKPAMLGIVGIDYLFYALKGADFSTLTDHAAKGKTLNKKTLAEIEILIPSIQDQNRIVSILDKLRSISYKKRNALNLLDQLSISLFTEMFGNIVTNTHNWKTVSFDKIITQATYGTSKPLNNESSGVPVLRMNNITHLGRIEIENVKYANLNLTEKSNLLLQPGDILFNRTNSVELVGKTAVWDQEGEYYFAGYLVRVRIDENEANPYFVSGFLNSDYGKQMLYSKAKPSGSMANFSPSLLKRQAIFIPPIDVQNKYEEKVKEILRKSQLLSNSFRAINLLRKSLEFSLFRENIERTTTELDRLIQDKYEQQLLINKLGSKEKEFETFEEYDRSKKMLFHLLERQDSIATQRLISEHGIQIKIGIKDEIIKA